MKKMAMTAKVLWNLFWANKHLIAAGIYHSVRALFLPKQYLWVRERKRICDSCPFNSGNDVMPNPMRWRRDKFCIACKCNLFLKQYSPECSCGLSEIENATPKWNKI